MPPRQGLLKASCALAQVFVAGCNLIRSIIPYPTGRCFRGGLFQVLRASGLGYDHIVPRLAARRTLQICNLHPGDRETMIRPEHFI